MTRHYWIWVVLLIGCSIFPTNQTHYLDLGSDMSSVCACSWDVISRENQCWCREMSALFSSDRRTYLTMNDQKIKTWACAVQHSTYSGFDFQHSAEDSNCWSVTTFALCNQINWTKLQNLLIWLLSFTVWWTIKKSKPEYVRCNRAHTQVLIFSTVLKTQTADLLWPSRFATRLIALNCKTSWYDYCHSQYDNICAQLTY